MSVHKHAAQRAVIPLKRKYGLTQADVTAYAAALVASEKVNLPSLSEAVTAALDLGHAPAPHELVGLALMARKGHAAMVASHRAAGVAEGEYVADHDCHNCGGLLEYRAPFLWCEVCNSVNQLGRHPLTAERVYVLTRDQARDLRPGPDHVWAETPEEAEARIRGMVSRLAGKLDMNAAIAGDDPADLVADIQADLD